MAVDIRLPHITGLTEKEQLKQINTYLFQLAEQLQWALNNADTSSHTVIIKQQPISTTPSSAGSNGRMVQDDTQATFAALKPLIIKSAEIVEAYYEEINKRLEGLYVAQSDFGTFAEQTSQEIEVTSKNTTQQFENMQVIITGLDNNVGSIESSIHGIVEDLSYTQNDIIKLGVDIEDIGSSVASVEGEIGELDTTLKAVEGNVNTLDTTLKAVEVNVTNLDSNLKSVEGNVTNLDNNLKTVEGAVGGLDTNLKAVETDLNDTKVGIGSSLESISEEVGVIDKDLQGVKAGVKKDIGDLTDEVGKVDTKLEDAKSALNADLGKLKDSLDALNSLIVEVNARIKSGLLYYDDNGIPVYGLEVGQTNTVNGVEVFNKFARFTAGRLSFYDNNGTEVAYISDYKIYITHAEVTGTLKLGGYLVDTSNGVTFKWVGRS